MNDRSQKNDTDWKEEIFITGNELVDRIKELVAEGNVRRLIIRKPDGESVLEPPLTAGVAVGGVVKVLRTLQLNRIRSQMRRWTQFACAQGASRRFASAHLPDIEPGCFPRRYGQEPDPNPENAQNILLYSVTFRI